MHTFWSHCTPSRKCKNVPVCNKTENKKCFERPEAERESRLFSLGSLVQRVLHSASN